MSFGLGTGVSLGRRIEEEDRVPQLGKHDGIVMFGEIQMIPRLRGDDKNAFTIENFHVVRTNSSLGFSQFLKNTPKISREPKSRKSLIESCLHRVITMLLDGA